MVPTRPRCPVMVRNFRHWPEILRRLTGGKTGDMLRIGCGNPWNWMLMLFEPDLGRLWQESLQDRCLGRIQSTSPTSRNSKKDCLISPFIVIYRNLWGNPMNPAPMRNDKWLLSQICTWRTWRTWRSQWLEVSFYPGSTWNISNINI